MSDALTGPTVCVALVTFNRKLLLLECLDALLRQTHPVDAIFIVDNGSTDGTADLLRERGYLAHRRITLFRQDTNTGGAGGFHRGLKLGHDAGFTWIWLMDDDAEPADDALAIALRAATESSSAVANFKVSADGVPQPNHMLLESGTSALHLAASADAVPLRFSSFVGLLVRGAAIPAVGLPRAEFFLNGDDTEYCMRLRRFGPIPLAPGSVIRHKEAARGGYVNRSVFGIRNARAPFRAFVMRYFELRNTAVILRLQHGTVRMLAHVLLRSISLGAAVLAFRDDRPIQRLHIIFKAHADALRGRFDNDFPFRLLRGLNSSR